MLKISSLPNRRSWIMSGAVVALVWSVFTSVAWSTKIWTFSPNQAINTLAAWIFLTCTVVVMVNHKGSGFLLGFFLFVALGFLWFFSAFLFGVQ